MFRDELFGGLKKGGRTGDVLSLQMVNEAEHGCLFFGRKRIHGFNEALAGHPGASIAQARERSLLWLPFVSMRMVPARAWPMITTAGQADLLTWAGQL